MHIYFHSLLWSYLPRVPTILTTCVAGFILDLIPPTAVTRNRLTLSEGGSPSHPRHPNTEAHHQTMQTGSRGNHQKWFPWSHNIVSCSKYCKQPYKILHLKALHYDSPVCLKQKQRHQTTRLVYCGLQKTILHNNSPIALYHTENPQNDESVWVEEKHGMMEYFQGNQVPSLWQKQSP